MWPLCVGCSNVILGPFVLKLLFRLLSWSQEFLFPEWTTEAVYSMATTWLFAAFPLWDLGESLRRGFTFSWCKSRPIGKIRCETHPGDPSPKGARMCVGKGQGTASAVFQIREQACHSRSPTLITIKVWVSFTLCLLVFSWHVERQPPHRKLQMSYSWEKSAEVLTWANMLARYTLLRI